MSTITFRTHDAFLNFMTMAHGMWTNARDDSDAPRLDVIDKLIHELEAAWLVTNREDMQAYPMTLSLRPAVVEMAETILENCLDSSNDDDDDEDVVQAGDVTIQR